MFRHSKPAALTAAAILTAGLAVPAVTANAAPATAAECVQAGLVWVHVQYDETTTGACAEKFRTAQEALLDTGLTTQTDAYVTEIDGRTAKDREWWSVYSKSPADGAYPAEWEFAQVGLGQLELSASDVLALVLQPDWEVDAVAPTADPVEGVTLDATPTPEPSTPAATPSLVPSTPAATPSAATPTPAKPTVAPTVKPGLPDSGV
ncbi:hypothetical protein [Tessaracoccus flavescens]|uniref:DUF4430 domain-containing protein n=1 Tax=Tessaracoccus flavescens TaxID=399497 RepID=A0A1Q2D0R8_9ACTN|nr:hypothetical protein [Tessaracoccus flavescens]AQP51861.1 hypothetical protein BW733_14535 [Tessaracoccus flavescens]